MDIYNKLIYCLYGVYSIDELRFLDNNAMNLQKENVVYINC
jgi:hypothetical protein